MTRKVMYLVDKVTPLMVCPMCGSAHSPLTKRGGGFHRGAWQCPNGCAPSAVERATALLQGHRDTLSDQEQRALLRVVEKSAAPLEAAA